MTRAVCNKGCDSIETDVGGDLCRLLAGKHERDLISRMPDVLEDLFDYSGWKAQKTGFLVSSSVCHVRFWVECQR